MEKFNEIRNSDKYKYLSSIMSNIKLLTKKNHQGELVDEILNDLETLVGHEYIKAYNFHKKLQKIEDYCDIFFDCSDQGFSYQLGCRYQKIKFESVDHVDAEIKWLEDLLKIYDENFNEEMMIIDSLIIDLKNFKNDIREYKNIY